MTGPELGSTVSISSGMPPLLFSSLPSSYPLAMAHWGCRRLFHPTYKKGAATNEWATRSGVFYAVMMQEAKRAALNSPQTNPVLH